ncbi:hypothetical protein [Halobacteriovorax sp. HLS]|uniref:hypothetical protein n=1 Tax=Halobacteriovorax sp. HLS TaxID=2234000 RepID=UPI000FDC62B0|nr:hypothetical protein [Halobacteriovorax sp. HLS]
MINKKFQLKPYKESDLQVHLQAEFLLKDKIIELRFELRDPHCKVNLEQLNVAKRVIGLWEKTCFEFFILNTKSKDYYEFNFSPSSDWNCFYFSKKGDPLNEYTQIESIETEALKTNESYQLTVKLHADSFHNEFLKPEFMKIALTSVLKSNEELSYWAISHQDLRPNFHHFDSFVKLKP